jgi:hypothetical protein
LRVARGQPLVEDQDVGRGTSRDGRGEAHHVGLPVQKAPDAPTYR